MLSFKQFMNKIYEAQEYSGAGSSIPQVSAGLTHAVSSGLIKKNDVAVDVGGGRYDLGKDHVESNVEGAKLHVQDPYNRSEEHNKEVDRHTIGKSDYVGCHNVLNVIKEPEERAKALQNVKSRMKPRTGIAHITVWDGGSGKGDGKVTKKDTWQNRQRTKFYLPEIKKEFPEETHEVSVKNNHIVIRQR